MTNREQKSKVMSLSNRLAVQMGRSAAFIQAWAIVKAGGITLPVKGVTFGNRQEALKRLSTYAPEAIRTFLVPEPNNPVDANAIAIMVMVQNGRGAYRLGYVPVRDTGIAVAVRGKASIRVLPGDIHGARLTLAV